MLRCNCLQKHVAGRLRSRVGKLQLFSRVTRAGYGSERTTYSCVDKVLFPWANYG